MVVSSRGRSSIRHFAKHVLNVLDRILDDLFHLPRGVGDLALHFSAGHRRIQQSHSRADSRAEGKGQSVTSESITFVEHASFPASRQPRVAHTVSSAIILSPMTGST